MYLCATKLDLIESGTAKRAVDLRTVQMYATAIEASFFQTSAKTGDGVDEIFTQIAKVSEMRTVSLSLSLFLFACTC